MQPHTPTSYKLQPQVGEGTSCYVLKLQHHGSDKRPKVELFYIQELDIKTHSRIHVVCLISNIKLWKNEGFIYRVCQHPLFSPCHFQGSHEL